MRLKVLLSAYACEPDNGSEPGVGWGIAQAMARYHDVWVITRTNNRRAIEGAMRHLGIPRVRFVYHDLPPWARWWKHGERGLRLYYSLWQIGAYIVAQRLHRTVQFDLVHHVTFGKYWTPSYLALLPVPFVWGPVGGAESAPNAFWASASLRVKMYERLREVARSLGDHNIFVTLTARRSALALAKTEETAQRLRRLGAKDVRTLSEAGLSLADMRHLEAPECLGNLVIRFISVGRLIYWKGFHLGLRAFARAGLTEAEYWIIGDGPERKNLETAAETLGVRDRVCFWGPLRRTDTLQRITEAHVLVHPSLHDSGGWVCLEAMAAARPVICLDLGGPATQVTEHTGLKIPARDPDQTVDDLARAMRRLANDPTFRQTLGAAGRHRVWQYFRWECKGEVLDAIYRQVMAGLPEAGHPDKSIHQVSP